MAYSHLRGQSIGGGGEGGGWGGGYRDRGGHCLGPL